MPIGMLDNLNYPKVIASRKENTAVSNKFAIQNTTDPENLKFIPELPKSRAPNLIPAGKQNTGLFLERFIKSLCQYTFLAKTMRVISGVPDSMPEYLKFTFDLDPVGSKETGKEGSSKEITAAAEKDQDAKADTSEKMTNK